MRARSAFHSENFREWLPHSEETRALNRPRLYQITLEHRQPPTTVHASMLWSQVCVFAIHSRELQKAFLSQ